MLGPVPVGERVPDGVTLHRLRLSSGAEYLEYKCKPAL